MAALLSTTNILVTGALLFVAYTMRQLSLSARRRDFPFPPGPKPSLLLGNLRDLPTIKPWEVFHEWNHKYGDIIHLSALKDNFIILTSYEAISHLLEQRSSIYSDRRYGTMVNEIMGFSGTTVNLPYGSCWRKHRKIYNKQLNLYAVKKLESHQSEGCKWLLVRLLETPENFDNHINLSIAQIIMGIGYDYKLTSENDDLLWRNLRTSAAFAMGSQPGCFLVDLFPFLRYLPDWFPGTRFKQFGKDINVNFSYTRETPFNEVKARMMSGTARPCLVTNVLSQMEEENETSEEDIVVLKEVAAALFGAGTTTTAATIKGFIISMIVYPKIQARAHQELDTVLKGSRLPEFADQSSLPYITALVKETLRWSPATPAAIPHVTSTDDVYKGYFIPKGSIIIPNAWSVLRDPSIYENPFEFRPERFLAEENNGVIAKDPAVMGAFGYGRRICPGRFLVEKTLWLVIASMLTVYQFDYAVDEETGERFDVSKAYADPPAGLLNHPQPFRCSIKPRSEQHERLIQSISA